MQNLFGGYSSQPDKSWRPDSVESPGPRTTLQDATRDCSATVILEVADRQSGKSVLEKVQRILLDPGFNVSLLLFSLNVTHGPNLPMSSGQARNNCTSQNLPCWSRHPLHRLVLPRPRIRSRFETAPSPLLPPLRLQHPHQSPTSPPPPRPLFEQGLTGSLY